MPASSRDSSISRLSPVVAEEEGEEVVGGGATTATISGEEDNCPVVGDRTAAGRTRDRSQGGTRHGKIVDR
jgi:hypothetical protein